MTKMIQDQFTRFSVYSFKRRRWFRGSRFWRWTRFYAFAAKHDTPFILSEFLQPRSWILSERQKTYCKDEGCFMVRVEYTVVR